MLTVKDIANNLNIGINQAYTLVRSKNFSSFKTGQKYFIPEDKYQEWINNQISNKGQD